VLTRYPVPNDDDQAGRCRAGSDGRSRIPAKYARAIDDHTVTRREDQDPDRRPLRLGSRPAFAHRFTNSGAFYGTCDGGTEQVVETTVMLKRVSGHAASVSTNVA
jgi:hypothetical protein